MIKIFKIALLSIQFFIVYATFAQHNFRVIALDNPSIKKLGSAKVLIHFAEAIKTVASGDIIFDMSLWEPVDYNKYSSASPHWNVIQDYKVAQEFFFVNVNQFCATALNGEKFFISAPRDVLFRQQAENLYLKSLSNLNMQEYIPPCVEFAYVKGKVSSDSFESNSTVEINLVKLKQTDLEHMVFAVNRSVWHEEGEKSNLKGVERTLTLDTSLVDSALFFDSSYKPVGLAVSISELDHKTYVNSEITVFSGHFPNRDSIVMKKSESGEVLKVFPGYFVIILGIEQVAIR